jgi:hypothetical protein
MKALLGKETNSLLGYNPKQHFTERGQKKSESLGECELI